MRRESDKSLKKVQLHQNEKKIKDAFSRACFIDWGVAAGIDHNFLADQTRKFDSGMTKKKRLTLFNRE